jgi:DNA-binding MarR family transcriptional regulator
VSDPAAARRAAVLAALEEEPGLTLRDVADRCALDVRHAAMLLWRLEEDGLAVHEARRWYPRPGH